MRRLYILFFCLLLVGSIVKLSFSEENWGAKIDGYKWKSLENVPKLSFVAGFAWGVTTASSEGVGCLQSLASSVPVIFKEVDPKTKEWVDKNAGLLFKRLDLSEISFGQIVDGLDNFYNDYRNMKVLVQEAIWIVKLEVRGAPQEYIDEETRLLRIPGGVEGERGKEWYNLLTKNQAYKEAWDKWGGQIPIILR